MVVESLLGSYCDLMGIFIGMDTKLLITFFIFVQSVASPVLRNFLQQSMVKNGIRYVKIPGVPCEAVNAFVRFLYSSW